MKTFQRILIIGSLLALNATAMGCGADKDDKQAKAEVISNEVYGPPTPQVLIVKVEKADAKRTLANQIDPLKNSDSEFVSR